MTARKPAGSKQKAGRKPKYSDVELFQQKIDCYFSECSKNDRPPTVCGLALHLDLTRQGLIEYQGKPEFSDAVKKAKQRVETFLEERLYGSAPAGTIFNLKNNFGWKDSIAVDNTSSDGSMTPKGLDASKLSTDTLRELMAARGSAGDNE